VNEVYLERNIAEEMLEINHLEETQSFGTGSFAGQKATLPKTHLMHHVHSYAYDSVEVHL